MLYAIFSDLHANESALRHALDDARTFGVEEYVCLGDIVGYGPSPVETLLLVQEHFNHIVAGNHDDAVSGRMSADDFIGLAADSVSRHRQIIARNELNFLKALPYTDEIDNAHLVHGDGVCPHEFYYIDNEDAAAENFSQMTHPLLFCGHTHVPLIYAQSPDGKITIHTATDFKLTANYRYIINPGSIGYPRENGGRCESTYILYDSTARTIHYRRLPFSVSSVMQRGTGRSHHKLLYYFAALIIVTLITLVFVLSPRQSSSATNKTPEASATGISTAIETRTLTIPEAHKELTANLYLKPNSPPADLRIIFYSSDQQPLDQTLITIRKSSRRNFRIPPSAATVQLEILPHPPKPPPLIRSFAPFSH